MSDTAFLIAAAAGAIGSLGSTLIGIYLGKRERSLHVSQQSEHRQSKYSRELTAGELSKLTAEILELSPEAVDDVSRVVEEKLHTERTAARGRRRPATGKDPDRDP